MGNIGDVARSKLIKQIAQKYCSRAEVLGEICMEQEYRHFQDIAPFLPEGLKYLENIAFRLNPKLWFGDAESAVVCAFQYWDNTRDSSIVYKKYGQWKTVRNRSSNKFPVLPFSDDAVVQISRYDVCGDYHKIIRTQLEKMTTEIKLILPDAKARIFVDTSPLSEKNLAVKSGLGWRGKNTLVMNSEIGSYFFIGGILLSVKLENTSQAQNSDCQDCDFCVKACPAKALSPYQLDAGKCISYWTTQNKSEIPDEIKKISANKACGCDICQEICPFNKKTDSRALNIFNPL